MMKSKVCRPTRVILFFICLALLIFSSSATYSDTNKIYTFGLLPQGAAFGMYERWLPFIEKVSKDTEIKFKLMVYDHVFEFENKLMHGLFDFVYLHSAQEAQAYTHQKYIPLIRSERYCKGALFVEKNSNITKLEDLKGKAIALVSQKSLCSIVLQHALNDKEGIENYNIIYGGSPTNVFKNVLLNKAVAGGTLDVTLSRETGEDISKLRLIYETPPMAPHPIAAHPRIPEKMRIMVREAIMRIAQDDAETELLKTIRMPPPLVYADYSRDYKELEKYVID
jgi:phosphonate transport system substrate-binding protein